MGIVLFPARRHGRASAGSWACRSAKTEAVIEISPRSRAARSRAAQYFDGIEPRDFQLLTAGTPTPHSLATSVVSPSSVMISTTPIRAIDTSRGVKLSTLHSREQDNGTTPCFTICMVKPFADIGLRLLWIRVGMGKSQAEMGEDVGANFNGWSQWETGERRITLDPALRLFRKYGWPLEWIYENQAGQLGLELRAIIVRAQKKLEDEAAEAAATELSTTEAQKTSRRVKRKA